MSYTPIHPVGPTRRRRGLHAPIRLALLVTLLVILYATFHLAITPPTPDGPRNHQRIDRPVDLQLPTL